MLFGETKPRPVKMTVPEYKQYLAGNCSEGTTLLFTPEHYQPQPAIPTPIPALDGTVTLLLTPRPAERPRFSKFGGAYNSKAYSSYKKQLTERLKAKITEGQINPALDYAGISVQFFLPVPKSWTKKAKAAAYGQPHRSKPDADNYLKAAADAMTEAGVFRDDGQVAQMSARKWYVGEGQPPRIEVQMLTLDQLTY